MCIRDSLSTNEDALKESSRLYIKHFNNNVWLNRLFMHLTVRAVLYLGKQELAFRGHHEELSSSNHRNLKELLEPFVLISPVEIQNTIKKSHPSLPAILRLFRMK